MTQAELAQRAGISQQVYARLESPEKSNLTLSTLDKVAQALGIRVTLAT